MHSSGLAGVPVDEDFADFDALAARAQGVFERLAAADDADAAQFLGEIDAHIRPPRRRDHALLRERQMPQSSLHHLTSQQHQFTIMCAALQPHNREYQIVT